MTLKAYFFAKYAFLFVCLSKFVSSDTIETNLERNQSLSTVQKYPERELGKDIEIDLMIKAKDGDVEAFGVMANAYYFRLYNIANNILRNHEDSLDAVQACLVKAMHNVKQFDLKMPFMGWLFIIVKNHCLNIVRNVARSKTDSLEEMQENKSAKYFEINSPVDSPKKILIQRETREIIWASIGSIPDKFREIIVMFYFHEMSYKEIAEALSIPKGTVMSRLFNARQEIKKVIQKRFKVLAREYDNGPPPEELTLRQKIELGRKRYKEEQKKLLEKSKLLQNSKALAKPKRKRKPVPKKKKIVPPKITKELTLREKINQGRKMASAKKEFIEMAKSPLSMNLSPKE